MSRTIRQQWFHRFLILVDVCTCVGSQFLCNERIKGAVQNSKKSLILLYVNIKITKENNVMQTNKIEEMSAEEIGDLNWLAIIERLGKLVFNKYAMVV